MPDKMPAGTSDCLPVYVVLDTSGSMEEHEQLLNETLENLIETVANKPNVAEYAHICIISFNTDAHVIVELTDVQKLDYIPEVACDGMTSYGNAFRTLKQRIDVDVPALRKQGRGVLRPTVFLLTDGIPSDDDWATPFEELVDKNWSRRPHIVTFGFGDAPAEIISRVATKKAFLAKDAKAGGTAITEFLGQLLNTMVRSQAEGTIVLPAEVKGFDTIVLPHEHID